MNYKYSNTVFDAWNWHESGNRSTCQTRPEHACLDHQHFIKRCIPKLPLFLVLTGTVVVFERTHAYLYMPCCERIIFSVQEVQQLSHV